MGLEDMLKRALPVGSSSESDSAGTNVPTDQHGIGRRRLMKWAFASATLIPAIVRTDSASASPIKDLFIRDLADYFTAEYVQKDGGMIVASRRKLYAHGAWQDFPAMLDDLSMVPVMNKHTLPQGFFVSHIPFKSLPHGRPFSDVVKIHQVISKDYFDGFVVDGKKRNDVFGYEFGKYTRVFLGPEVFSTFRAPQAAVIYGVDGFGKV